MPIANRALYKTFSWATPRLDLGGCGLYVPLWRPDMVARGGGIKNGDGTLDVSPQNLAVGANTITATGAGTFIITVPQSGTCASGTATITGSPVTLNAGVATTVTTGATTGTFTVTTSNIIRSRDSTGHLCTVIGATWGLKGRTFDGDDSITIPHNNILSPTDGAGVDLACSIEAWINMTDATNFVIVSKGSNITREYDFMVTDTDKLRMTLQNPTAPQYISKTSDTTLTAYQGQFIKVTATYDGSETAAGLKFYLNGQALAGTTAESGYVGVTRSANGVVIGRLWTNGTVYATGKIGVVRYYQSRILSAAESLNTYYKERHLFGV